MTLIAYIQLLAVWGCACCWESDECVVGRHGLICWQDWHTEWEGELGESGRKLLAAEQGWHHQSWYNQSWGCKRALQSRAEGLGYVSPPEVMHSAASPACSAWGGFGGILGGHFDVASLWCLDGQCWWSEIDLRLEPSPASLTATMKNEDKRRPLQQPMIFIGYTGRLRANRTRARA